MRCDKTVSPMCPGHVAGRSAFRDCLTAALAASQPDDQAGDVDVLGVHYMLFVVIKDEVILTPAGHQVNLRAGTQCLVATLESGIVRRLDYDTPEAAQEAFELCQEEHARVLDERAVRERLITSSTGRIGW